MSEDDFSHHLQQAAAGRPPPRVVPRFHTQNVELTFKSTQEGRPCFEEREFVEIIIPGNRGSTVVEPVNAEHKGRWPVEYEAFKQGREAPREGTPLTEWPVVNRARVEELAYFHIKTVEELAGVNDNQLQNLGMGARELREAAKKFLEVAKHGTGPLMQMMGKIDELTRENERLTRDNAAISAELAGYKQQETANASAAA